MDDQTAIATSERISFGSRLLAGALLASRVRDRQFRPERFTRARRPARFAPPRRLGRDLRVERTTFRGWPVFELTPAGASGAKALYLHGGAWAAEIQPAHWRLIARLAGETSRTFVVPIYPLVPAVTHRDVTPVLVQLWREVAATAPTALVGDSAGAVMALALLDGREPRDPRPDVSILLSPAVNPLFDDPESDVIAPRDPLLRLDHVRELARLYAEPEGPGSPAVNPLARDLGGLGDLWIFTGTRDVLHPDARRFASRAAAAAGTAVELVEAPEMIHDWMLFPTPEGREAVRRISALLRG